MTFGGVKCLAISAILFIFSMNVESTFEKCSDAPKAICGPNAKCLDDYYNLNSRVMESVCKCNDGVGNRPPECHGCRDNDSCKTNEYCDNNYECKIGCHSGSCKSHQYCDINTRKCTDGCLHTYNCDNDEFCITETKKCGKICEIHSCPANSACTAKNHSKYCSCNKGYFPEERKGCRPESVEDEKNINCNSKCGDFVECSIENGTIYCHCPYDRDADNSDKASECNPFDLWPTRPVAPKFDESIISLTSIAVLAG